MLVSAAELGEQSQYFEVKPNESDHQSEAAIPFHVLRNAGAGSTLDKIEIQHQVECGNDHHHHTETDTDHARAVDGCEVNAVSPVYPLRVSNGKFFAFQKVLRVQCPGSTL